MFDFARREVAQTSNAFRSHSAMTKLLQESLAESFAAHGLQPPPPSVAAAAAAAAAVAAQAAAAAAARDAVVNPARSSGSLFSGATSPSPGVLSAIAAAQHTSEGGGVHATGSNGLRPMGRESTEAALAMAVQAGAALGAQTALAQRGGSSPSSIPAAAAPANSDAVDVGRMPRRVSPKAVGDTVAVSTEKHDVTGAMPPPYRPQRLVKASKRPASASLDSTNGASSVNGESDSLTGSATYAASGRVSKSVIEAAVAAARASRQPMAKRARLDGTTPKPQPSIKEMAKASRKKKKTYVTRLHERVAELEEEIKQLQLTPLGSSGVMLTAGQDTQADGEASSGGSAARAALWRPQHNLLDDACLQVYSTVRKLRGKISLKSRLAALQTYVRALCANMCSMQDTTIEHMVIVMASGPCGAAAEAGPGAGGAAAEGAGGDAHSGNVHRGKCAKPGTARLICDLARSVELTAEQRSLVAANRAKVSQHLHLLADDKFIHQQFTTEMTECLSIVQNLEAAVNKILRPRQQNKFEDFILQNVGELRLPWLVGDRDSVGSRGSSPAFTRGTVAGSANDSST